MLAVAATVVALSGPPRATIRGTRLAVSSWCWAGKCGAPIAAATRTVHVRRGQTVRVELAFAPRTAHLAIAGRPQEVSVSGTELSWRATRPGGLTLNVTAARGFVIYVGRLAVS